MTVQPKLHISEYLVVSKIFIVSGAIQCGVPLNEFCFLNSISSAIFFAPPKSDNLHTPSLSTKILAPFMSFVIYIVPL